MTQPNNPCSDKECDDVMRERIRYFTGRHLSACDFRDEQAYHRTHRLFHNRIMHGWGVVCGLEVRQHTKPDCRTRYVEVTPGIALDCCGREVVVDCLASCGEQGIPEIPWAQYTESHPLLLLCLSFEEKQTVQTSVLHHEGDCSETKTDYARVKEGWKLCWRWIAPADLPKYEWKNQFGGCPPESECPGGPDQGQSPGPGREQQAHTAQGVASTENQGAPHIQSEGAGSKKTGSGHPQVQPGAPCAEDDCGDPCSEGYKSCLEPRCPPGHCIPLAIICAEPNQPLLDTHILMKGRPEVPYGAPRLTHIAKINWPHGGVITPAWFTGKDDDGRERHGCFRVIFDRKLQPTKRREYPGPWGINEATFVVQYGEPYEDLDFVISDGPPSLLDNLCEAQYKVAFRKHHAEGYHYMEGHVIWITVKCDFLYDCHGVRVDGNNDGVAGGTFESWVSVVSEEKYEQLKKDGKL
jgi:hypothetical protein